MAKRKSAYVTVVFQKKSDHNDILSALTNAGLTDFGVNWQFPRFGRVTSAYGVAARADIPAMQKLANTYIKGVRLHVHGDDSVIHHR